MAKQSVKSIKQVEDFYYNIGVFAGLFYCLSTTDMHFENVIVNEEVPFLIDIESLANGLLSTVCGKIKVHSIAIEKYTTLQ